MGGETGPRLLSSGPINQERLWRRHMELAKVGEIPLGGVNRQALSPEDAKAQLQMIAWAAERNFSCYTDAAGNLFIRRDGSDPNAPPVVAGSHLDTQPNGGKFDGASGVLTAFEALEAICDHHIVTKRPIEVVSWMNEEGSRFELGCTGSLAFSDPLKLDTLLAQKDANGTTAAAALADVKKMLPDLPERPLGFPLDSFLELHIEQGRVLETAQKTIGIVTGIQGSRKFIVEVTGENAHSGTTPASARKDALFAAVDIVTALRDLMRDPSEQTRFTIGRFEVLPGALNVVPSRVVFTIDFRHPSEDVLTTVGDRIERVCKANAGPCSVVVTDMKRNAAQKFGGAMIREIEAAAARLGFSYLHLPSLAGHDARNIAKVCPTGMIFVPCEKGISHNELEHATPEDLAAGARVLAEVIVQLANR
jgi:N-carbamoyl-L-amino-acid hydrolase